MVVLFQFVNPHIHMLWRQSNHGEFFFNFFSFFAFFIFFLALTAGSLLFVTISLLLPATVLGAADLVAIGLGFVLAALLASLLLLVFTLAILLPLVLALAILC